MKPFTKLFSSIISSSIWRSPKETKVVWITMLAMADKEGEVWASVGGLADMARVTREECRGALDELLSPDEDSRTKEHDGRRIEAIDGGWRVLNYKKYRDLGRTEDRREYYAEHKRQARAVHNCPQKSTMSPIAEAEAEAEADTEAEGEREAPTPPLRKEEGDGLEDFLKDFHCKTIHRGEDLIPQWRLYTKGLKPRQVRQILEEARPGIQWPSEFRSARKERGI